MYSEDDYPRITRNRLFSCQVCVPKAWTDKEALDWLTKNNPCGTSRGWKLCVEGDELLGGDPARVQCVELDENVHIVFAA